MNEDEMQRALQDAVGTLPAVIEKELLDPKSSPSTKLKWTELAIRICRGPSGRPLNDDDIENKRKAAEILKATVPDLQAIRDAHQSASLRKKGC